MPKKPNPSTTSLNISIVALIISNSIPLIGVLFFQWSIFMILILYWLESAVIGFFNVLKMIKCPTEAPEYTSLFVNKTPNFKYFKLFIIPFFIIHYSGFMGIHLIFIIAISSLFNPNLSLSSISNTIPMIFIGLISLFISHGISYVVNYIGKREYQKYNLPELMTQPYKRIFVMHLTLLFGAFLGFVLKMPALLIALLIVLKTLIDVGAHIKEHTVIILN